MFINLVLCFASCLALCYLMSCSAVCMSLKCNWNKFNVIWLVLHFTNAYVDIILCDFSAVGQTSPHRLQPPMDHVIICQAIYVCVLIWTLAFYVWNVSTAKLRLGRCQTLVDMVGSCGTQVWQPPNSGLAAAKLGFGSCQTRIWQVPNSDLAAAKV